MDITKNKNYEGDAPPSASSAGTKSPKDKKTPEEDSVRKDTAVVSSIIRGTEQLSLAGPSRSNTRLCGSARKRLKFLLEAGFCREEAMGMAIQKPMAELRGLGKRSRSDGSTPEGTSSKRGCTNAQQLDEEEPDKQERTGVQPVLVQPVAAKGQASTSKVVQPTLTGGPKQAPLFSQTLASVKVAIAPDGFPTALLSMDQLKAIQRRVIERIEEQAERDIKPKFLGCSFKPGWLSLNCGDKDTAEWIKATIPSLNPWEGAKLVVLEGEGLPRHQIFTAYLPMSEGDSNEKILRRIQAQNELRTSQWRVIHREPKNSMVQLVLSVDHASAERIKRENGRINYLFGNVYLRSKRGNTEAPRAEAAKKGKAKAIKAPVKTALQTGESARPTKPARAKGPPTSSKASRKHGLASTRGAAPKPNSAARTTKAVESGGRAEEPSTAGAKGMGKGTSTASGGKSMGPKGGTAQ